MTSPRLGLRWNGPVDLERLRSLTAVGRRIGRITNAFAETSSYWRSYDSNIDERLLKLDRSSNPKSSQTEAAESGNRLDRPVPTESNECRSLSLQDLRLWLHSQDSEFLGEDFRNLLRFRYLLKLILEDFGERIDSLEIEKLSAELCYETGQEVSNCFRAIHGKLDRHPIRLSTDKIAELTWRSLIIRTAEAVTFSDRFPTESASDWISEQFNMNRCIDQDKKTPTRIPSAMKRRIDHPHDSPQPKNIEPITSPNSNSNSKTTSEISLKELIETLRAIERFAVAIGEHHAFLSNSGSGASPARKNRLGLSEIQIAILRSLYPDKLLSAIAIAEGMGIPLSDKGSVPFEGQLKREATMRRQGLIEAQRGVEGGYYLSDLGRKINEECAGLDRSDNDAPCVQGIQGY